MTMIYFDNSSTTLPDEEVMASFVEANRRFFANPASIHGLGTDAEKLLERAKEQMLKIVHCENGEVIVTSGGTESNNLAVIGFARALQHRGNHIITTSIEHPSILNACRYLEEEGFEVDYMPVDEEGCISVEKLIRKIKKETILVSIMHVNNEIGSIQPIQEIAKAVKERSRAVFHSDCVQSFGKIPVAMDENGPDAITLSAHKINGLKGTGALIMKHGIRPQPLTYGGGQEKGLRNGTVSVPNAVALAKAMRMSAVETERKDFREWRNELIAFCNQYENIKVIAENSAAPHILSLSFKHINGEVAINYFQENDIYISTSSACSSKNKQISHVIEAIHLENSFKNGVVRLSFGKDNHKEQIEICKDVIKRFMELMERGLK
ncbi:cysteine desulfurase family protein [Sporosarcina contaminans]|uniref:Cysteine desulfurase family protein n=1 Tax=Sporosarcina contaminans TaxID=633403 RepID=A0ABW3U2T5_9BACL